MDNLTPEQRKKNMKAIKNKDSKSECVLRKALWEKGYRYRKNYNKLIGKPDIVFVSKKVAIFVDGEFFHGYNYKDDIDVTGSNQAYWNQKIKRNIERDKEVTEKLQSDGWVVLRFWSKQVLKDLDNCVSTVERALEYK